MKKLLAATCLTPLPLAIAFAPAAAETVISTATTTPVATGTASDDIRITSAGSVRPTSGAAVTINSNHSVTNQGAIGVNGANNATGVLANTNLTGNITNANGATITIDENFTPTDTDSDGDTDGPFAQGTGRFGIHVLGGGTFTGTITNSGAITVEGNQSGGIAIDSALTGSISNAGGSITVLGNDSVGLRASSVSGNVTLSSGTIAVVGANSIGVDLTGNIGGALVIQNTVQTTGYRHTVAPADTSKLDADDLLQGGSAVVVGGNVAGGILFDTRPADNSSTDTDEDDDGVPDANETTASITSFGGAPAVSIGSASQNISVGAVASSALGHGLVVKGSILGTGVYKNVASTGLSIGGTNGNAVTIAGGMTVNGNISARAVEANATAVRIGTGASVPVISVTGVVGAEGGGAAGTSARAILIESGATVTTLRNSGTIAAARAGTTGTAAAIVDQSGTLTLIENSGVIGVSNSEALGDNAIAFDLSANASGTTVRQLTAAANQAAPSIRGVMQFGSGNDLLDVADGLVLGAARFGAGNNTLALSGDAAMIGAVTFGNGLDTVQLAGTSTLTGNIDFGGGGGTLSLAGTSRYNGSLANSAGVAVTLGAGTQLALTNLGTVGVDSLTTGTGSRLGITIDGVANTNTLLSVAGAANFGSNTALDVNLTSVGGAAGTYTFLQAGSITGAGNLSPSIGTLPFLYDSSLVTTVPNQLSLTIRVKTAEELGLNRSEGAILGAVIDSADSDTGIAGVLLDITDSETLQDTLQQLLPEHAGGTFENATRPSRLTRRILLDPNAPVVRRGGLGFWLEQVAWGASKSIGDTSDYDVNGWGAAGGAEFGLGDFGQAGLSLAYYNGNDSADSDGQLRSNQFEGGVYWRGGSGPLRGFARATVGKVKFKGERTFTGLSDGTPVTRTAEGDWDGTVYSAAAGVSYEARMGSVILRPTVSVDHYKLDEKGYAETGGGDAFNLIVDSRDSSETAANASLAVGYDLFGRDPQESWMRVELEGGRRQRIGGELGETTARFADGESFTLEAEERTSGWLGGLRLIGGGSGLTLTGEINAEEQRKDVAIGGRRSLQLAM